jgi:Retinal pigment epithelial membrane protein
MITEDYVVLIINPATFDFGRVAQGASPLAWEADRGTRVAVLPRRGSSRGVRWIETDAFWCWHYANAWQAGGEIITLNFGVPNMPGPTGYIARARIDPAAGTFRLEMLDDSSISVQANDCQGWIAVIRSSRLNDASAPRTVICDLIRQTWLCKSLGSSQRALTRFCARLLAQHRRDSNRYRWFRQAGALILILIVGIVYSPKLKSTRQFY